jgi:subtilisin family serine protease
MEHTPTDFYINGYPVSGLIFERSLRIEAKDLKDEVVDINQKAKLTIELIEGEEGTLSCDDKNICNKEGESVTVSLLNGIFTLEQVGIQGKVGKTYTLKFTSQDLISTTLTVTIKEAGEPAKLSIKQQPSDTAENGVALQVKPIITTNGEPIKESIKIQLTDISGNFVKKQDVEITAVTCLPDVSCDSFFEGGDKIKTNESGEAKFENFIISGKKGHHSLFFISDEYDFINHRYLPININKEGKPDKFTFSENPKDDFTSESNLGNIGHIVIKDSGGNVADLNNQTGRLSISLSSDTNAELDCKNPEESGISSVSCSKQNTKKVTLSFNEAHVPLSSVTLAGKIGNHTLELLMNGFKQEFTVHIKNGGIATKITILNLDHCLVNPSSGNPSSDQYCYLGEFKQDEDKKELRLQVLDKNDNPSADQTVKFEDKARPSATNVKAISDKDGIVNVEIRTTEEDVYETYKYMWGLQPHGSSWVVNPKLSASINNQKANKHSRVTLEITTPLIIKLEWPYENSIAVEGLNHLKDGLTFHKLPENGNVTFDEDQKSFYSLLESKIDQAIYHINNNGENEVFDKFIYKYNVPDEFKDQLGDKLYPTVYIHLKNDPEYQKQWYLHSSKNGGINLNSAILLGHQRESNENGYTGDGIKIGIIGDEIYSDHDDIDEIQNFGEQAKSISRESTNVAGLIVASGWNSRGIRGVAPNSLLKSFSILDNLNYAPDNKDYNGLMEEYNFENLLFQSVDIYHLTAPWATHFNSETSIPPDSKTWEKIWEKIWEKTWFNQPIIRGSGNSFKKLENSNPSCKAKNKSCQMPINDSNLYHPAIINVAALDKERKRASYSIYNSSNWISAPGGEAGVNTEIITTCHAQSEGCQSGYTDFASTSASAALVTGVLALMLEANPKLDWRDIKYILAKTAVQIDKNDNGWITNKAGYKFHNAYGFGAIDAKAAVQMAINFTKGLSVLEKINPESKQAKAIVFCTVKNEQETEITITQDIYLEYVLLKLEHEPSGCLGETNLDQSGFISTITEAFTGKKYIEVTLKSPSNKTVFSQTLDSNSLSYIDEDSQPIIMMPSQFFGENTAGNWTLTIKDHTSQARYGVKVSLSIYGTKTDIRKTTE